MAAPPKKNKVDADGIQIIATNRRARHDFFIEDTYECGIVLRGSEVKSLRESKVQIAEAFGQLSGHEMWIHGLHISPYSMSQRHSGHDPVAVRKLLLHRREIDRITQKLQRERLAIVPLKLYFKDGRAKLEIGLGVGKKNVDKRQDIAKRDAQRDARRELGRSLKGNV